MVVSNLTGLQTERLMEHMRVLCSEIGPRQATSRNEYRAAEYVQQTLWSMGIEDVRKQTFNSRNSMGTAFMPYLALGALSLPTALIGGRVGKILGGLMMLGSSLGIRDLFLTKPPLFEPLISTNASQNIIARIPSSGPTKRIVYLIGHLDSNKQRFMFPNQVRELTKPGDTAGLLLGILSGLSLIWSGLRGQKRVNALHVFAEVAMLYTITQMTADEAQPVVQGANDNASAVSVLLGIAEAVKKEPLQNTEINLLFTGCEEVGCVGIERFIEQYAPPKENSYWIDIEMVGAGDLCYITKHGVSYLTEYRPDPRMTATAGYVANQHPELGVQGKDMLIIEEVACLRRNGYNAVCVGGYDQKGFLKNWHRTSDTLENIEPDTLTRAAQYVWKIVQAVDGV